MERMPEDASDSFEGANCRVGHNEEARSSNKANSSASRSAAGWAFGKGIACQGACRFRASFELGVSENAYGGQFRLFRAREGALGPDER